MNKAGVSVGKFFLYIAGKVIAVLLAAGVVALVFWTALNTMDVSVMVKDGFAKRASVILIPLENDDTEILPKVFTQDYLQESGLAEQTTNAAYSVKNYAQRTDVSFALVLPWVNEIELTVKDVVESIHCTVAQDATQEELVDELIESGEYRVRVVKDDEGMWKIDDIVLEEKIVPDDVVPVPTPAPASTEEAQTENLDDVEQEQTQDNAEND